MKRVSVICSHSATDLGIHAAKRVPHPRCALARRAEPPAIPRVMDLALDIHVYKVMTLDHPLTVERNPLIAIMLKEIKLHINRPVLAGVAIDYTFQSLVADVRIPTLARWALLSISAVPVASCLACS
eukprot:596069-Pleurochrysis_carterae.AAC.2